MDLAPCSPSILDLSEIIWYHRSLFSEKEELQGLSQREELQAGGTAQYIHNARQQLLQQFRHRFLVAPKQSQQSSL